MRLISVLKYSRAEHPFP